MVYTEKAIRHGSTVPALYFNLGVIYAGRERYTDAARDKVITPFDPRLDGVEIHATLAHNILHGELLLLHGKLPRLLLGLFRRLLHICRFIQLNVHGPWYLRLL